MIKPWNTDKKLRKIIEEEECWEIKQKRIRSHLRGSFDDLMNFLSN